MNRELNRANEILKSASIFSATELDGRANLQSVTVRPHTYFAAKARSESKRAVRDSELKVHVARVHAENFGVCGAAKVRAQHCRVGIIVARCSVERLLRGLGLRGAVRGKPVRTTISAEAADRPRDLVDRKFVAPAPNRLWVADLAYVRTWSGFVYVGYITDVSSPRIVGWQASRSLKTELVRNKGP